MLDSDSLQETAQELETMIAKERKSETKKRLTLAASTKFFPCTTSGFSSIDPSEIEGAKAANSP